MADAEEEAAEPNQRQGQNQQQNQQQQNQDAAGQQHLPIIWSNLNQNFQENQKRMQKCICYVPMTG